jgi:hypothetical protein
VNKKNKVPERIKVLYVLMFTLGAIIIAPTHIFPQPYFMYARFPHYLELMKPFLGISWPASFEIYHYMLYVLAITTSLNALGVLAYPRFKNITILSSLFGLCLFSLMILFFFFKFIDVHASTAIIFGLYSVILLIVDLLTFKALTK